MGKANSFSLVIFTKNEIESLPKVMPLIDEKLFTQILIVDANSTDGTVEWCRENGYDVFIQKSYGLRQAYQEALQYIKGDYMITFSPDGNSIPELLPMLINKINEGYDMVIVSRYLDGAKSEDDDIITGFGNWLFTKIVNILHGGKYTDVMVMYRGYRKAILEELDLTGDKGFAVPERLFNTRIGMEPLLSTRAARAKMKIGEIPGDEPRRIGGERKLEIVRWGLAHMYQFIAECFRKNKYKT